MEQQDLIHEDWRDSLRHLVKALGGYDAVGVEVWPGKTRKAAGAWLSDCLNPERAAKLDLEELQKLLLLGRARGVHLGITFLCDELGYTRPSPVEPADQVADLVRQQQRLCDEMASLAGRMERLQERNVAEAVPRFLRRTQ